MTANKEVPDEGFAQPPDQAGVNGHGEFGSLLRRRRNAAQLTLEQLAAASGVSARAISDMERGRSRGPQRRTVQALADALSLRGDERAGFLAVARAGRPHSESGLRCALPRAVPDFSGRAAELSWLTRIMAEPVPADATAPVATVSGAAGFGKTTLAVQAAYLHRDQFRDGVFFVDLRGMDTRPLEPAEALMLLLTALGLPAAGLPPDLTGRAGLYRELLRNRHCLVVLDNAADEAQVRPLLPGVGQSVTVVTSRRLLAGLEGVYRLNLAELSTTDARELLRRIVVDRDTTGELDAVDDIVELCGRLPLALRIAGNRLVSRSQWTARHLANRLSDERRRLGQLTAGDLQIGTAFHLSYEQLSPPAQRSFRRLSLVPGPDFDAVLAIVLTGAGDSDAEDSLDELLELGLLQDGVAGRYRFHDLVRLFARERLAREEPLEAVSEARTSMMRWLLSAAVAAGRWFENDHVHPSEMSELVRLDSQVQAAEWLDVELKNWTAAGRWAAEQGRHAEVVELAEAMHWFSDRRLHLSWWLELFGLSAGAAAALGDRRLEAVHRNYLSWAQEQHGDLTDAVASAMTAYELADSAGDITEQGWAFNYAGRAYRRLGQTDRSTHYQVEAAKLFASIGDVSGHLQALGGVIDDRMTADEPEEALRLVSQALIVVDEPDNGMLASVAVATKGRLLGRAARACRALGALDDAIEFAEQSCRVLRRDAARGYEISSLRLLAELRRKNGQLVEAGSALAEAADVCELIGDHAHAARLRQERAGLLS